MEFRPARPSLRDIAPLAFLALILLVLVAQTIFGRATPSLWGLTGLSLLVAGGTWLILRPRFPGSPKLRVDGERMSYIRGGRERGFKWRDVTAIRVDFTRNEMHFMSASGEAPIVMYRNMIAADGQRFEVLLEDYWQPPPQES